MKISAQSNLESVDLLDILTTASAIYVKLLGVPQVHACVCLWNLVCEVWSRLMRQISNSKGRFLTIDGNSDEEGSTTDNICRMKGKEKCIMSIVKKVSHTLCMF